MGEGGGGGGASAFSRRRRSVFAARQTLATGNFGGVVSGRWWGDKFFFAGRAVRLRCARRWRREQCV